MTQFILALVLSTSPSNPAATTAAFNYQYSMLSFQDSTKTNTTTFKASNMGCSTDSKMVETALYRKKGVKKVKIDGETISVTFNPAKISVSDLKTVIENTGTCEDPNAKVHEVEIQTAP
jgi:copper chaperone CopZ